MRDPLQSYYDNAIPIIPVDELHHTDESPFCNITLSPKCPCREDDTLIQAVNEQVQEGLLTTEEATRTVRGEML